MKMDNRGEKTGEKLECKMIYDTMTDHNFVTSKPLAIDLIGKIDNVLELPLKTAGVFLQKPLEQQNSTPRVAK